jgi:protein-disulfide isomerase
MLRHPTAIAGLALVVTWLAACQPQGNGPAPSAEDAKPVASIDGATITQGELDAWIKEELFRNQTENRGPAELYELRSRALERMLEERVLEAEARSRGISTDEVLRQERAALGPVGDEQVTAFYEKNKKNMGGSTLEQMKDRIRSYLDEQRSDEITDALRERAEIEVLLDVPRVTVTADGPSRGPADAPVTIVEFSDFQCPFCARVGPTLERVLARYPKQVRIVYRHLPLESMHPRARAAAEASACADAQGRFWEFHDKLFANQRALAEADLQRYAKEIELDAAAFQQCVKERKFEELVDRDLEAAALAANASGKRGLGTPAFFVNGILLSGAKPAEEFFRLIDAELARAGTPNAPAAGS